MIKFKNSRNYIVIKDKSELEFAKSCDVCGYIILESDNVIYMWTKLNNKWEKEKYIALGQSKEKDEETTGMQAYQQFYSYCGKNEVDRMKTILKPIADWESHESMHYANYDYSHQKLIQPIFEFDANSAFTYGTMQLPEGFYPLKEYMRTLFEKKQNAITPITRSKYKNLQNYLIGYFKRINAFISTRSYIINESNKNIEFRMIEIVRNGGKCFLSNTDSIVTDDVGAAIMMKYTGDDVGQFKLATVADRLYYKSPNAYQLGDKVVYSGVKYFARKNTDFFAERYAEQHGNLVKAFNFSLSLEDDTYRKLCRVTNGVITVNIFNKLGELLNTLYYKLGGSNE